MARIVIRAASIELKATPGFSLPAAGRKSRRYSKQAKNKPEDWLADTFCGGGCWCDGAGGVGLGGGIPVAGPVPEAAAALGTGGAGLVGSGGFGGATSIFAGSRGSKPFDSAMAANLSRSVAVVSRWVGQTCRQPLTRSLKQPRHGSDGSGGYFPFTIASLLPEKHKKQEKITRYWTSCKREDPSSKLDIIILEILRGIPGLEHDLVHKRGLMKHLVGVTLIIRESQRGRRWIYHVVLASSPCYCFSRTRACDFMCPWTFLSRLFINFCLGNNSNDFITHS
jgi:hypothetical protein